MEGDAAAAEGTFVSFSEAASTALQDFLICFEVRGGAVSEEHTCA